MTTLSARFKKSPGERQRYILDYTRDLDAGETVTVVATAITSTTGNPTALIVDGILIAPSGIQVVFYAGAGIDTNVYEVQFLATTSLGKILEDVVEFDVGVKV